MFASVFVGVAEAAFDAGAGIIGNLDGHFVFRPLVFELPYSFIKAFGIFPDNGKIDVFGVFIFYADSIPKTAIDITPDIV